MKVRVIEKPIVMILMFAVAITANAQSDFEIAQSFMQKKGITLQDNPKTSINRAASNKPYSIYNGEEGKGFAIVVNGSIVGYSTENSVDVNDICPTLETILEDYAAMPSNRAESTSEFPSWYTPRDVTPIEPLLTTKWGQHSPFNDMLNMSGICGVVSEAQIFHYFKAQIQCEVVDYQYDYDFSVAAYVPTGLVLPKITFNHDLMLNKYNRNGYTKEQGEEVAKWYYYIFYSREDYHLKEIEKFWNMEKYCIMIKDITNIYEFMDSFLERKLPFQAASGTHSYCIDGRDSQGLYHINVGWGGDGNGYYAVPSDNSREGLNKDIYNPAAHAEDIRGFWYIAPLNWDETVAKIDAKRQNKAHTSHFYNLSGQYVGETLEGLPKGVYVSNGKKVFIK